MVSHEFLLSNANLDLPTEPRSADCLAFALHAGMAGVHRGGGLQLELPPLQSVASALRAATIPGCPPNVFVAKVLIHRFGLELVPTGFGQSFRGLLQQAEGIFLAKLEVTVLVAGASELCHHFVLYMAEVRRALPTPCHGPTRAPTLAAAFVLCHCLATPFPNHRPLVPCAVAGDAPDLPRRARPGVRQHAPLIALLH